MAALVQQLQLGRCAVVGYSLGGRLALLLAARWPHLFTKAAVISGTPGIPGGLLGRAATIQSSKVSFQMRRLTVFVCCGCLSPALPATAATAWAAAHPCLLLRVWLHVQVRSSVQSGLLVTKPWPWHFGRPAPRLFSKTGTSSRSGGPSGAVPGAHAGHGCKQKQHEAREMLITRMQGLWH